jgi:2,3-bisphosphoglycerate-dependent phosphoglycerate mutase
MAQNLINKSGKLVLIRHTESKWNSLGKWTGWTDISLDDKGFHDAQLLGQLLKDIKFDHTYCSELIRAKETLECVLDTADQFDVLREHAKELNERNYGDFTGKNKWEVQKEVGKEKFEQIRRGWNCPISNGETLRDVYSRVTPFYLNEIVPKVMQGKNVLIVSHGNNIRALIKYIEDISDDDIAHVEMLLGAVLIYQLDGNGKFISKETKSINIEDSKL